MALAPDTIFANEYRIVRLLDEGGMGAVYLAEQLSTGRQRALKTMHAHLARDAKLRQRFAQEARVGAQIPSEHIVEVIGAGVDPATDMPWLAMELLEGETLAKRLEREKRLPVADAITIFDQMCHALEAAHEKGIVHRDLKPENIFLEKPRRRDVTVTVKVLDFGIAKWLHDARAASANSTAIGTPLWMAPEQAKPGTEVSPATDVWALGLLAFTLLTGHSYWIAASFPDADVRAVLAEILTGPLDPASKRAASLGCDNIVSGAFDLWFGRCVTRDLHARYRDAAMARAAFEIIAAMESSPTPRPAMARTVPMDPMSEPASEARASLRTSYPPQTPARLTAVAVGSAAIGLALISYYAGKQAVPSNAGAAREPPHPAPVHSGLASAAPDVVPSIAPKAPTPLAPTSAPTAGALVPAPIASGLSSTQPVATSKPTSAPRLPLTTPPADKPKPPPAKPKPGDDPYG